MAVILLVGVLLRVSDVSFRPTQGDESTTPRSHESTHPPNKSAATVDKADTLSAGEYEVARVVDGDTLRLVGGARVRLLGIDTPEVFVPGGSGARKETPDRWGPEASAFAKQFVAGGRVRLEFDGARQDQYGRYLAYVWVGDKMLNEELLRQGLARHTPWFPYSDAMKKRLGAVQQEAKRHRRGLWSAE